METINLKIVNEKIIHEKLKNGLDVYIVRKKDFNGNNVRFFTKFGALDREFVPINEKSMAKMPSGVAHFLEHKLFEQESGISVDDYFKKTGSYINAFTNYKNTCYHFFCSKDLKKNLEFLLDFVQSPYFTDENVEKEKGIIVQEALMNLDDPDRKFYQTMLKNLFTTEYYDDPVVGNVEDIKNITKEDLYRCYNTFYHPVNMVLMVVTNLEEKEVLKIIKDNQKIKNYKKRFKINKKEVTEEDNVKKEYEELLEVVNEKRMSYALKINMNSFEEIRKVELYYYLDILLSNAVGSLSEFNLELREKNLINGNIQYEINFNKSKEKEYIIINFIIYPNNESKVIELLDKKLQKLSITEKDFNLFKKNIISNNLYQFNSINGTMAFLYGEYNFSGEIKSDCLDIAEKLSYKKEKEIIEKIPLENKSIVVMKPKMGN